MINGSKTPSALWILNQKAVSDELDETELAFLEYQERQDLRIKNQKGLFTNLIIDEIDLGVFLKTRNVEKHLVKYVIPPNCFQPLARHLKLMDITHSRLFPGLEGHTKDIVFEGIV